MIYIVMNGMCEGCRYADLELSCEEDELLDGPVKRWRVRCIHRDACDSMETKTIQRLKGARNDVTYTCPKCGMPMICVQTASIPPYTRYQCSCGYTSKVIREPVEQVPLPKEWREEEDEATRRMDFSGKAEWGNSD